MTQIRAECLKFVTFMGVFFINFLLPWTALSITKANKQCALKSRFRAGAGNINALSPRRTMRFHYPASEVSTDFAKMAIQSLCGRAPVILADTFVTYHW